MSGQANGKGGLELRGLSGGYGSVPFLNDLDLTVDAGQIVALLGANGAGKSSTIMTIAGHAKVASGECLFDGEPLTGAPHLRARQGIGLLTQERCTFMELTLRDNLRLGLGDENEVLTYFPELEQFLDKRAGLLSGGQQQMLAVGRILAAKPRLMLIDELSLGLAPLMVDRILSTLDEFRVRYGTAVILVEQHVHKALAVADKAYVLQRGRIVMSGTTDELKDSLDDLHRAYIPVGAGADELAGGH